ncbi:Protein vip1 [Dimargaris verticillata]|uniref:Protein vip1 n=1 Tax=Dimargaris verticillata TaxID=2761393 RepID=A0A9W8B4L4_9FUNG|nr:Protein vip1 [Dimargaris verticillata]
MASSWNDITLPAVPAPTFVYVTGIALEATETAVKDFFTFCGRIQQFQLRPAVTGKSQEALVEFEKDSAAKTAVLLSNAMIAEQPIEVKYYYDTFNAPSPTVPSQSPAQEHTHDTDQFVQNRDLSQEEKPKTSIVQEIVASGYLLSEKIMAKAHEYDTRYGLSTKALSLLGQAKQGASTLDQKLKVSENIKQIDEKYKIQDTVTNLTNQALSSTAGQRVSSALQQAKEQGTRAYQDGVKLAEERKQQQQREAEDEPASSASPSAAPAEASEKPAPPS